MPESTQVVVYPPVETQITGDNKTNYDTESGSDLMTNIHAIHFTDQWLQSYYIIAGFLRDCP